MLTACSTTNVLNTDFTKHDFSKLARYLDTDQGEAAAEYVGCLVSVYKHAMTLSIQETGIADFNRNLVEKSCKNVELNFRRKVMKAANCSNNQCPVNTANTVINDVKSKAYAFANLYKTGINNED